MTTIARTMATESSTVRISSTRSKAELFACGSNWFAERPEKRNLGPHELRFDGDAARFWGGRLVNGQGVPISDGWESMVSARPIAPTENRPFAQIFQYKPDPRAKTMRLTIYDGLRADVA